MNCELKSFFPIYSIDSKYKYYTHTINIVMIQSNFDLNYKLLLVLHSRKNISKNHTNFQLFCLMITYILYLVFVSSSSWLMCVCLTYEFMFSIFFSLIQVLFFFCLLDVRYDSVKMFFIFCCWFNIVTFLLLF